MSESVERAIDAVADAIKEAASGPNRTPAQLKTLAEAAAQLRYGPQGSVNRNHTRYDYNADYHSTTHQGEDRPRPGAGFGDRG